MTKQYQQESLHMFWKAKRVLKRRQNLGKLNSKTSPRLSHSNKSHNKRAWIFKRLYSYWWGLRTMTLVRLLPLWASNVIIQQLRSLTFIKIRKLQRVVTICLLEVDTFLRCSFQKFSAHRFSSSTMFYMWVRIE